MKYWISVIRKRYAVMKKKKRKFEMSLKTKANIVGTCAIVFELLAIAVAVLSVIFYLPGGALATLFLMVIYCTFRDAYRDFRMLEIDEELDRDREFLKQEKKSVSERYKFPADWKMRKEYSWKEKTKYFKGE